MFANQFFIKGIKFASTLIGAGIFVGLIRLQQLDLIAKDDAIPKLAKADELSTIKIPSRSDQMITNSIEQPESKTIPVEEKQPPVEVTPGVPTIAHCLCRGPE